LKKWVLLEYLFENFTCSQLKFAGLILTF